MENAQTSIYTEENQQTNQEKAEHYALVVETTGITIIKKENAGATVQPK